MNHDHLIYRKIQLMTYAGQDFVNNRINLMVNSYSFDLISICSMQYGHTNHYFQLSLNFESIYSQNCRFSKELKMAPYNSVVKQ